MIDVGAFIVIWTRLCRRFGRTVDNDEALDYLAYLEKAGMDTASVSAAAEAVWATREFFPKPADFLSGEAAIGWTAIQYHATHYHRETSGDDARELLARIPPRALAAIKALGGLDIVKQTGRDRVPRLRKDYFEAFASVVIEESVAPTSIRIKAGALVGLDVGDKPGDIVILPAYGIGEKKPTVERVKVEIHGQ